LHQRLGCFVRKSLSFSKSDTMHEPCPRLFLHDYNKLRALSSTTRFVKKGVRAALGYGSFGPADRTIQGVEAVNMRRKGQVKRLHQSDAMGQPKFV
jgi:hypothetical protein